ncbi:hypothetical protein TrLO_g15036 [Triparma laevis f. longispina]|uniref:Uncharacterized protein n=1 Tax=Triparma laevis f. longispina TaxID=1714387 RepID=A0A9W6ZXL2_9STRA|nr:hypothetical protein TrLO_g15036 [Triparma laevis f. longispina]
MIYSFCSAALLFASPGSVRGFPSETWPDPLMFCIFIVLQGYFLGGFKGLNPTMLKGLWLWMDGDPAYTSYNPRPAFQNAVGMTNAGLCLAAAIGAVTAYCAYFAPENSLRLTAGFRSVYKLYDIWFYVAGLFQCFAGIMMYLPKIGVKPLDPNKTK